MGAGYETQEGTWKSSGTPAMLRRIIQLQHIGLFHNGTPEPLELRRVALIYGENGRGKSTLSAVLDSCARNRPDLILSRRTIDEPAASPAVQLVFDTGRARHTFGAGGWDSPRPDVLIFDSQFVQERVHTGLEILSTNRLGLYEFALGDAVQDVRAIEAAGTAARAATHEASELDRALRTHAAPLDVADFRALPLAADGNERLDVLRRQVAAARAAHQILRRPDLVRLQLPDVNLDHVFVLLQRTLPDVHQEAEARVRQHLVRHPNRGLEDWISRGHAFENGEDCPYCGQAVHGLDLLAAYRGYFNEAYGRLKGEIEESHTMVLRQWGTATGLRWFEQWRANTERQNAWADHVPTEPLEFDDNNGGLELDELQRAVLGLLDRKRANPLQLVGTPVEREQVNELLRLLKRRLAPYNTRVDAINALYAAKRQEIAAGDVEAIERGIVIAEKTLLRHRQDVAQLVADYNNAEAAAALARERKDQLRIAHDERMADILGRYQERINARLRRLRAGFSIEHIRGAHPAGQAPRTVYAIHLRGVTVRNLERSTEEPSVPTVLSDGDRRALALAFFLARLDIDGAAVANNIVVFDDPMTSFDTARTAETVRSLAELADACQQLIVLSHDAYFLRDLNRALSGDVTNRTTHKIGFGARDYAIFTPCDLSEICGQPHVKRQRQIVDYLDGRTNDPQPVAEGLRILVEDYYKHRYPMHTHELTTLGGIIQLAEEARVTPLHALRPLLPALRDFNAYASQFHHPAPGQRAPVPNEDRLRHYCRGVLSLIHDEGQSYRLLP